MYDDNFGWYDRDGDEQETVAFYLPQYAYCNSCADAIERGWDVG